MDVPKLKKHAELLEQALRSNAGKSKDVDWLSQYSPLLKAITNAKANMLLEPEDLGLGRWELESNIRDFPEVSHRLAQFCLLAENFDLPSDLSEENKN